MQRLAQQIKNLKGRVYRKTTSLTLGGFSAERILGENNFRVAFWYIDITAGSTFAPEDIPLDELALAMADTGVWNFYDWDTYGMWITWPWWAYSDFGGDVRVVELLLNPGE